MSTEATEESPRARAKRLWLKGKAHRHEATVVMEQAVAGGDVEAHVDLAYWLLDPTNEAPTDTDRAMELFATAAKHGHGNAQLALQLHQMGLPIPTPDWDGEVAAQQGKAAAQRAYDGAENEPLGAPAPIASDVRAHSAGNAVDTSPVIDEDADHEQELFIDGVTGDIGWRVAAESETDDADYEHNEGDLEAFTSTESPREIGEEVAADLIASADDAETEAPAVVRGVTRQSFAPWAGKPAPDLVRANLEDVGEHVVQIVECEQPVMVNRLVRLYARDLGMQRLKGPRKQVLISAIRAAVRARNLDQHLERRPQHPDHWALFMPDHDGRVLRGRGSRPTGEIPLREIAEVIRAMQVAIGTTTHDSLRDIVMREWFSLGAVGAVVRDRFDRALNEVALEALPFTPAPSDAGAPVSDDGWFDIDQPLRQAAEAGDALAQLAAGVQLVNHDNELAQLRGERLLRSAAANGDALAIGELARYLERQYAGRNEALTWTALAADGGDLDAINSILSVVGDADRLDYQPNRAAVYRTFLARKQLDDFMLPASQLGALGTLVTASRRLALRRRLLPPLDQLARDWHWDECNEVVDKARQRVERDGAWFGSIESLCKSALPDAIDSIVELAERLGAAGLQLIPDPRFDGVAPRLHEAVVLRQTPSNLAGVDQEYTTAVTLTRLAVAVAAADGEIAPNELAVVRDQIASSVSLSHHQADRLSCVERYLLASPPDILDAVEDIADQLSPAARVGLSDFLVEVAIADGILHESEVRLLTQLFTRLQLDPALIAGALRDVASATVSERPVEQKPAELDASRKAAPVPVPAGVDAIRSRLRNRFAAVAAQLGEPSAPALAESTDQTASGRAIELAGLDRRHEMLVRELANHDLWNRADAEDVANALELDLAEAVDVIRTWSNKLFGEPIMELSDAQLEVRVDMFQELLAA